LTDRGFSRANGIHSATRNQAYTAVRLNQRGIRLQEESEAELQLAEKLQTIQKSKTAVKG
jgi:hypothetical protein